MGAIFMTSVRSATMRRAGSRGRPSFGFATWGVTGAAPASAPPTVAGGFVSSAPPPQSQETHGPDPTRPRHPHHADVDIIPSSLARTHADARAAVAAAADRAHRQARRLADARRRVAREGARAADARRLARGVVADTWCAGVLAGPLVCRGVGARARVGSLDERPTRGDDQHPSSREKDDPGEHLHGP